MRKGNMLLITIILFVFILQMGFVLLGGFDLIKKEETFCTINTQMNAGQMRITDEQMKKLRKLDTKSMKALYEKYKKYYEVD